MTFGEKLKYIRTEILGMTQAELADSIGSRQGTINALEMGANKEPSYHIFKNLVLIHGINPFYFLTNDKNETPILPKGKSQLQAALNKINQYETLIENLQKIKSGRK